MVFFMSFGVERDLKSGVSFGNLFQVRKVGLKVKKKRNFFTIFLSNAPKPQGI